MPHRSPNLVAIAPSSERIASSERTVSWKVLPAREVVRAWSVLLSWGIAALALAPRSVHAQGAAELRELARLPAEVTAAVDRGVPERELGAAVRGMAEAGVPTRDILRTVTAVRPGSGDGDSGIGRLVRSLVDRGLRGEALAAGIHRELRARGIPAGGNRAGGPPPVARRRIPPHAGRGAGARGRDEERAADRDEEDRDGERAGGRAGPGSGPGRREPGTRGPGEGGGRGPEIETRTGSPLPARELGELGARIARSPERADRLLDQAGLTRAGFRAAVLETSARPDQSRPYAEGFRSRLERTEEGRPR